MFAGFGAVVRYAATVSTSLLPPSLYGHAHIRTVECICAALFSAAELLAEQPHQNANDLSDISWSSICRAANFIISKQLFIVLMIERTMLPCVSEPYPLHTQLRLGQESPCPVMRAARKSV